MDTMTHTHAKRAFTVVFPTVVNDKKEYSEEDNVTSDPSMEYRIFTL